MADITRRSAIALTASAAVFPAAAASPASGLSRLERLIADHTAAYNRLEEACVQTENAHTAAFAGKSHIEHVFILRIRHGVACYYTDDLESSYAKALARVRKLYDEAIHSVETVSWRRDETKRACLADLSCDFEADRADLRMLYDAEQQRQESHGLPQAKEAQENADRLEEEAGLAVLRHPCRSQEEIALRAFYMLDSGMGPGRCLLETITRGDDSFLETLLRAGSEA